MQDHAHTYIYSKTLNAPYICFLWLMIAKSHVVLMFSTYCQSMMKEQVKGSAATRCSDEVIFIVYILRI